MLLWLTIIALESPTFAQYRWCFLIKILIKVVPLHSAFIYDYLSNCCILLYDILNDSVGPKDFIEDYNNFDKFFAVNWETWCPYKPWPSATAKRWLLSPSSLDFINKLSWFGLEGFVDKTPCWVLYEYVMDSGSYNSIFTLLYIEFSVDLPFIWIVLELGFFLLSPYLYVFLCSFYFKASIILLSSYLWDFCLETYVFLKSLEFSFWCGFSLTEVKWDCDFDCYADRHWLYGLFTPIWKSISFVFTLLRELSIFLAKLNVLDLSLSLFNFGFDWDFAVDLS